MKYIKGYKIFESNGFSIEEVTNHIKDMLLDLEDDGFSVNVSKYHNRTDSPIINICIRPNSSSTFTDPFFPTFNSNRILIFTDRIKNYFDMEGIKYDIQYQWRFIKDERSVLSSTNLDELPSEIQIMWIDIFIEK